MTWYVIVIMRLQEEVNLCRLCKKLGTLDLRPVSGQCIRYLFENSVSGSLEGQGGLMSVTGDLVIG